MSGPSGSPEINHSYLGEHGVFSPVAVFRVAWADGELLEKPERGIMTGSLLLTPGSNEEA